MVMVKFLELFSFFLFNYIFVIYLRYFIKKKDGIYEKLGGLMGEIEGVK